MMKIFPAKNINAFYGYRTFQSRKSVEHWHFAQNFSAKEMMKWGFILFVCSFFGYWFKEGNLKFTAGMIIMICCSLMPIYTTEKALRSKFKK